MGNLNLVAKPCGVLLLCAAAAVALPGQTAPVSPPVPTVTFTSLVSFDGTDGDIPTAGLVQAANGDLYGTTQFGGSGDCYSGCGTVFKMMPNGALTTIYNFCAQQECPEGFQPVATLTLGKDGNLYGTTSSGGANECTLGDCGSIFKVTPNGALTVLYSFCSTINNLTCVDGAHPAGALVQATDGSFYGTTYYGGHSNPSCALEHSCGTIFKITPDGTFTTLYSFAGKDGANPSSQLIQGADGNFYGTASGGGDFVRCVYGCGTIFRITPAGILTTLYSFCSLPKCADGYEPTGGLVPGPDGKFYGTTQQGGGQHCLNGCGTIFTVHPSQCAHDDLLLLPSAWLRRRK